MKPKVGNGVSPAGSVESQSRREALKSFGRYVGVAPTAMVLLQPRLGEAKPGNGKGWGPGGNPNKRGWGRGGSPDRGDESDY